MFRSIKNWINSDSDDEDDRPSFVEATEDAFTSMTDSLFGNSEPRGPNSVIIVYGKHEIPLRFTETDFEAEDNPKDGITTENLKWAISRALTPYIFGDSKQQVSQAKGSMSRPSSTLNANRITVTFKGRKLNLPKKSLKSYGIKTGDKIVASLDSGTMSTTTTDAERNKQPEARRFRKENTNKPVDAQRQYQTPVVPTPTPTAAKPQTHDTKSAPQPSPKKPLTARDKIAKILDDVEKEIVPLINKFVANVPTNKQQRTDDHRIISESLLQKLMLLDGVDTSEEEQQQHPVPLRQVRKDAVNTMHKHMAQADDAAKTQEET